MHLLHQGSNLLASQYTPSSLTPAVLISRPTLVCYAAKKNGMLHCEYIDRKNRNGILYAQFQAHDSYIIAAFS